MLVIAYLKTVWEACWKYIVLAGGLVLAVLWLLNVGKSKGKATQLEKELKLEKAVTAKVTEQAVHDALVIQDTKNEVANRTDDQLIESADKWVRKHP